MATRVIPDPAGLEVVEPTTTYHLGIVEDHLKQPTDSAIEGEVDGSVAVAQPSTHRERNPQRSRLWIVGIVAVILVSLGAILGAILGTKLHHPTAPTSTVTITPSPEPSPTANPPQFSTCSNGLEEWRGIQHQAVFSGEQQIPSHILFRVNNSIVEQSDIIYSRQSWNTARRIKLQFSRIFWRSQFGNMPISYTQFCTNKCSSSKQSFSI
jgi:hypothetical protein